MGIYALLGSEVYLTPKIKDVIPINDRFVLVEVNVSTYPMYLYDKIFDLTTLKVMISYWPCRKVRLAQKRCRDLEKVERHERVFSDER